MSEAVVRSREEDDELQRSTKKVKENHSLGPQQNTHPSSAEEGSKSYKEKLLGEIPGAFEQAFDIGLNMELEAESDEEFEDLPTGERAVKFSGSMKAKIRSPWASALIVKLFGKTVGFHFLHARILSLWKPRGRMDCVALGNDFFLVRFQNGEDHARVLRDGPWFVGGHYLSLRGWEPNFKSSKANMSSVAVWIRLPELPIEYYEPSALRAIGETIGPVLRIDTHTAAETRGKFARLCVQVNLDEPITRLLRMGGIEQPVQYEGLNSLCFGCGRVGHQVENCPYTVRPMGKDDVDGAGKDDVDGAGNDDVDGAGKEEKSQNQPSTEEGKAFGPWVLVTRKRKPSLQSVKDKLQAPHFGAKGPSPRTTKETNPFISALGPTKADFYSKEGQRKPIDNTESSGASVERMTESVAHEKQRPMSQKQKDRSLSQTLKSKKKSRELLTRKGKDLGNPLVWKEVSGNPFSLKPQEHSEPQRVEIREFKAGGSMSQKGTGEESVMEEVLVSVEVEARPDKGSEVGTAALINSNPQRRPLLEISNQQRTEGGSRLEADKASIANCSLRRIDPSLRSRPANQMEEVSPARKVVFMEEQLGEPDSPDMGMKLDEGGEVTPSS
nr:uncharacterized protein CFP56_46865 [Quercus suber]